MKHFYNASRRQTIVALFALCGLLLMSDTISAIVLAEFNNYHVQSLGNNVLRFTIPVWESDLHSNLNDDRYYNLVAHPENNDDTNDSYLWYSTVNGDQRGSANVHRIASLGGGTTLFGHGLALLLVQTSSVVVANARDGKPITLRAGDASHWNSNYIEVPDNRPTYIQFDWYIPDELQDVEFYVGLNINCHEIIYDVSQGIYWWQWTTKFKGGSTAQWPQLFEPYFYSMVANGVNTLGKAAVQYVTYQDPISYTTSFDPNKDILIKDRSGSIIVDMQEYAQNFSCQFLVKGENSEQILLPSNTVTIPAYHQIHNFGAKELLNEQRSVTGDVDLSWRIEYENAQDIIESDMFEIQRATREDFSDARSIGVVPYTHGDRYYSYTDQASDVLTVLAGDSMVQKCDTIVSHLSDIGVYDGQDKIATIEATMKTDLLEPGKMLYYRIRRASSATWGWNDSPYQAKTTLRKANYLAPLDTIQAPYTLDPDYANNHIVHFDWKITNDLIQPIVPSIGDYPVDYTITQNNICTVPITINFNKGDFATVYVRQDSKLIESSGSTTSLTVEAKQGVPITLQFYYGWFQCTPTCTFTPTAEGTASIVIGEDKCNVQCESFTPNPGSASMNADSLVRAHVNLDSIKTLLYDKLQEQLQPLASGGRCIWDENADVILIRTIVETGETREIVVPHDSIVLQEDGSYRVHMTDVAGLSCVHYRYSVRIDQTRSTFKVQKPSQLEPIALSGPELYYNTSARIASFEATDGTDKRGVILTWQPTGGSLDGYTLYRRVQGSTEPYDTIAELHTEGYFDTQTVPGTTYEYKLHVQYTCNDTTTSDEATTLGRRSPYGSIAGRVQYEDGTGCYGITVTLSYEGGEDIKVVTDEMGGYLFDSLLYGVSTTYSIVPTSQTAEFHYNHTTTNFATITLTAENNEASHVVFENISSVRFTGRVLYKYSSIPVRNANLLLNGVPVKTEGGLYKTDISGEFHINVPQNAPFTLQVVMPGHTFEGDGYVRINGDSVLTLTDPQDGVRIWDKTKVRLAGRLVGGLDQANLPIGFGLSTNNLGDNLQMVLELEDDNVSYVVRDPEDLTKDTLEFIVAHEVLKADSTLDTVGTTQVHYQHKRIVINPDPNTGEYYADLFPVKYKIVQATAQGYATLFDDGQMGETLDLTNAVLTYDTAEYNSNKAARNAVYSITYRSPILVTYKQSNYGLDYDYFGIRTYSAQSLIGENVQVELATQDSLGNWNYLFGAPVYHAGQYQFHVTAHEDYYYNDDRSQTPNIVYLKGGKLTVHNGLRETTETETVPLDQNGSALVSVTADHVSYLQAGEDALHSLDFSVESEGEFIESEPLRAFILGAREKAQDLMHYVPTPTDLTLLDILRDPPGSGSSAYLEKGTSYHVKYKTDFNYQFGLQLEISLGNNNQFFVGTYAGVPAGATAGVINILQQTSEFKLPITVQYKGEHEAEYTFTTNQRIETSSDEDYVGSMADVFIGVTHGVLTGKADAFRIVDSISYSLLQGQIANGNAMVVQSGKSQDGKPWYLMRTEDVLLKQTIASSFTYTQEHIISTVIPEQIYYRNAFLLTGTREEAVAVAEAQHKAVYWSKVPADDIYFAQDGYYEIIKPADYAGVVVDQVSAANKSINNWLKVLETNEREKVNTQSETPLHTQSISGGVTQSYSESYEYADFRSSYVGYPFQDQSGDAQMEGAGGFAVAALKHIFAKPVLDQLDKHLQAAGSGSAAENPASYVRAEVGTVKFGFGITPVFETSSGNLPENGLTEGRSKETGYTIALGQHEHLTFNVYKSKVDVFNDEAEDTRHEASDFDSENKDKYLFGSLMYRTIAGMTRCPWEDADSTYFYNPGTPLNKATQRIDNPQIVIDKHEVSDVPHDQPARFNLTMWNELDDIISANEGLGVTFTLSVEASTNPNGAIVSIDGEPLLSGRSFHFSGAEPLHKVVEVRAGEGYDYEDICLKLSSGCGESRKVCLSVHYMPVSTDVHIAVPSDQWIMNTLSAKDDQGYYIPISIDGFDVNYRGFDHIELQYKLVTQSNDAWINLCSFYASDSLFNTASGTKEMILNGRISNYRFYGERDPMEQQYDLRAVSFCRHGSGFITRSSDVLTGTKDTRPPRVFGLPQPADGILTVEGNLLLRFNEPIAGNYLDEDNNFQVLGTTNASGITSGTNLHFDGTDNSYAQTAISRSLNAKSFALDMLVRPDSPDRDEVFFRHGNNGVVFGKTADNRLYVALGGKSIYSLPLSSPMTAFTRVIVAYDHQSQKIRFIAGTEDVTDPSNTSVANSEYTVSAPLVFGKGFIGDMLEVRLWTKALTTAEIAATHMKQLTGYEYGLVDYYPMNEGRGEVLKDKAGGAAANIHGAAWNLRQGLSMRFDGTRSLTLNSNLLSRSAIQDETLMLWFKTAEAKGTIFSAGRADSQHGTAIAFDGGNLVLQSAINQWTIGNYADNDWHHFTLTVNRTANTALIYIDGALTNSIAATELDSISGAMYIGSNGYVGNMDVLTFFEQALPKSHVQDFDNVLPSGEEMGLMGYLPFCTQKENANGIMETVYSPNDQRIIPDGKGGVKISDMPLIIDGWSAEMVDKTTFAPVREHEHLTKLLFDWAFNDDELLINLNMPIKEINKQSIYVTVRDVEDINGNPMVSPVMWTAFVDRNALKWEKRSVYYTIDDTDKQEQTYSIAISNTEGRTHQFTVENLPDWINMDVTYGTLYPLDENILNFHFTRNLPVGSYSHTIYLTDENGLAEPLSIFLTVNAECPWEDINSHNYNHSMAMRAQVFLADDSGNTIFDTDSRDVVGIFDNNVLVGKGQIDINSHTQVPYVYITVYGNLDINGQPLMAKLWQASSNQTFILSSSQPLVFQIDDCLGCTTDSAVALTVTNRVEQLIPIHENWNWITLGVEPSATDYKQLFNQFRGWEILLKDRHLYSMTNGKEWKGSLVPAVNKMYKMQIQRTADTRQATLPALLSVTGNRLSSDQMMVEIEKGWNWLPYTPLSSMTLDEALAGLYPKQGDIIKSQNAVAIYDSYGWSGNLKVLENGRGYLYCSMDEQKKTFAYPMVAANRTIIARKLAAGANNPSDSLIYFTPVDEHLYQSNMTMTIRLMNGDAVADTCEIAAFVGDECRGAVRADAEGLYYLVIAGEGAGQAIVIQTVLDHKLVTIDTKQTFVADSNIGTPWAPYVIQLAPAQGIENLQADDASCTKVLSDDHIYIIRPDGTWYDLHGARVK